MTTIFGSLSTTVLFIIFIAGFSSSSPGELEALFLYEHTKIINATAMSNNVIAKLPKRYGTGDFHSWAPVADDDGDKGMIFKPLELSVFLFSLYIALAS